MLEWLLNLTLFGEGGGDGGSAGGEGEGFSGVDDSDDDPIMARIPERARETYRKAKAKAKAEPMQDVSANPTIEAEVSEEAPQRLSYADLIKSDEYKAEHQQYMEKTINDRLRKYRGVEDELNKSRDMLSKIGAKYGLDSTSATFVNELSAKIDADDSYYEDYALEHDMSTREAKEMLQLKQRLAVAEQKEARARQEAEDNQRIQMLQRSAEMTKQKYPSFDLRTELQDERFRRILSVTNGDTKAAYESIHHDEIVSGIMQNARQMAQTSVRNAQMQTAQAIASNRNRPLENGLSSNSTATQEAEIDRIKHMTRRELAEYAASMRRGRR